MTNGNIKSIALWAVPAILVLGGAAAYGAKMLMPAPTDLDYGLTQASERGAFTATLEPGPSPITIGEPLTWTVAIAMADGTALAPEAVTVDGGMPQHGHGLPTEPRVTRDLGEGRFEVENINFSMAGWWVVNVHVGDDQAVFNFEL